MSVHMLCKYNLAANINSKWSFRFKIDPSFERSGDKQVINIARQFNGSYRTTCVKFHWITLNIYLYEFVHRERHSGPSIRFIIFIIMKFMKLSRFSITTQRLHSKNDWKIGIFATAHPLRKNTTVVPLVVGQWNSQISHQHKVREKKCAVFFSFFRFNFRFCGRCSSIGIRYKLKYANYEYYFTNAQSVRTRNAHARTL